jgi:hypothetical protein
MPIRSTLLIAWSTFQDGKWEQLTTPGSAAYHALWGPLITFEIIVQFVTIALAIATLELVFRKSSKAPSFAIALCSIGVVFVALDYFLAHLIPALSEQPADEDAITWAIAGAIWIPYFLISRRVKATFVR